MFFLIINFELLILFISACKDNAKFYNVKIFCEIYRLFKTFSGIIVELRVFFVLLRSKNLSNE
jgi:hypothetical protein